MKKIVSSLLDVGVIVAILIFLINQYSTHKRTEEHNKKELAAAIDLVSEEIVNNYVSGNVLNEIINKISLMEPSPVHWSLFKTEGGILGYRIGMPTAPSNHNPIIGVIPVVETSRYERFAPTISRLDSSKFEMLRKVYLEVDRFASYRLMVLEFFEKYAGYQSTMELHKSISLIAEANKEGCESKVKIENYFFEITGVNLKSIKNINNRSPLLVH